MNKINNEPNSSDDESQSSWDGIELSEKRDLANPNVDDNELTNPRLLSQLSEIEAESPLIPIPPDSLGDIFYKTRHEPRCVLCRAPGNLRERSEHWYIENSFKPSSVVNFFMRFYGVKVSWECVRTHMNDHCINMTNFDRGGLKSIAMRTDEIAFWKYREIELVMNTLLLELDEIKGMDVKRVPELMLKKTQRIESLTKAIREAAKQRDEAGAEVINVFDILKDLYDRIDNPESKVVIRDYVKELRTKLAGA